MADIAIFRINYKSDFILTLNSDAGWMTPFCIKFWTGAPSQAYFAGFDGTTYTHCAPVDGEPTKLRVQFDDHRLPIGDLKFQIGYHFTVADFPTSVEDEVLNQASVIIEVDDVPAQVMLDLNGETAPEIEFSLPAYANEAQRIANEEQRIAHEQQRIANEDARIQAEETRQYNEQQRIQHEEERVGEFARLKSESEAATNAANAAATLANEKAQLAADKAALADAAATLANEKAQLAADKSALAQAAATLANEKAALAQQKAEYAQTQGDYAKAQGDYAKAQGDTAQADHVRAEADHTTAADDHSRAEGDHTTAASDNSRAESDHTTAASDHSRAESDHTTAASDHTRAESDHTTAASDHTRAESDHTTAASDHETAASDHTRAESDHAAVEVYVDSLGAFDISSYHATGGELAKYANLTAALGTDGANIPEGIRKGGMSVKFVQSSDNNYVQYRYMSSSTAVADFTNVDNWQGVDDEPIPGSSNLVESRGVADAVYVFTLIDLSSVAASQFIINGTAWNKVSSSTRQKTIEVQPGYTYVVRTERTTRIALLKTYQPINGGTIDFSSTYPATITLNGGSSITMTMPDDTYYLYVETIRYIEGFKETNVTINNLKAVKDEVMRRLSIDSQVLSEQEKSQAISNLGLTDEVAILNNIDKYPTPDSYTLAKSTGIYDSIYGRVADVVSGRFITATGDMSGSGQVNYCCTEQYIDIEVTTGDVIEWYTGNRTTSSNVCLVLYNASKQKIGYWTGKNRIITIDTTGYESAKYLRVSFYVAYINECYVKLNNNVIFRPHLNYAGLKTHLSTTYRNNIYVMGGGSISIEESASENKVYFNFSPSILQTAYSATVSNIRYYNDFVTELGVTTEISPGGLTNCVVIQSGKACVFNIPANKYLIKNITEVTVDDIVLLSQIAGKVIHIDSGLYNFLDSNSYCDRKIAALTNVGLYDYVSGKCEDYRSSFNAATGEVQSFLFFTDPHYMGTSGTFNSSNMLNGIESIKKSYDNLPMDFCLCGGDWLNSGDTPEQACNKLGYVEGVMKNMFDKYIPIVGNHDTNYLGTSELSTTAIRNLWFRNYGKCYYDFVNNNTRYYIFDTGKDNDHSMSSYRTGQLTWLADSLLQNTDDVHIILCFHIYYYNGTNIETFAQNIINVAAAYNSRGTIIVDGVEKDFVSANGKVHAAFVGHSHADFNVYNSGIPVIGTINTQVGDTPSYDLVLVDYAGDAIKLFRIGTGNDRNISLTEPNG